MRFLIPSKKKENLMEIDAPHGKAVTPPCQTCARLPFPGALTCEAFPTGIPMAILGGLIDHNFPIPGDMGLTYLPKAG